MSEHTLITLDEQQVRHNLPWHRLLPAIEQALLRQSGGAPARLSYEMVSQGEAAGRLLVMPAWTGDTGIGMKTVTYWPENEARGLPSHGASYILMNARTAEVTAVLAAENMTMRRTAAVSVIAARRLMRADARRLLVVGAGPIAANLAEAHATAHDFQTIQVYARRRERAVALTDALARIGIEATVAQDLESAAGQADVISMATSATSPILKGEWVRPGTHVDLVGSFTPRMREADDELIRRAAAIWVDTDVAMAESGDLVQPIESGLIARSDIRGNLATLVSGGFDRKPDDITLFKAVGFALIDLAAAQCALAAT